MLATVCDTTDRGVGIAAPQVGVSRRLIAVQRFDKPGEPFCFYVNPEIVWYSQTRLPGSEGCLSIPGVSGSVLRSERIVVRYLDEESLRMAADTVEGFTAVIFRARGRPSGRRAVHRQGRARRGSPCPVVARSIPVALVCPLLSPSFASGTLSLCASGYIPAVSGNSNTYSTK